MSLIIQVSQQVSPNQIDTYPENLRYLRVKLKHEAYTYNLVIKVVFIIVAKRYNTVDSYNQKKLIKSS